MTIISYVVSIITIVGTVANAFQKRWCFWIWLITNAFWIGWNIAVGEYAQSIIYIVNLTTCIIGLFKWKRNKNENQGKVPYKNTFIEDCLSGIATIDDIDSYIKYWHTHNTGNTFREFLGLTDSEYNEYLKSNDNVLNDFITQRKVELIIDSLEEQITSIESVEKKINICNEVVALIENSIDTSKTNHGKKGS